MSNLDWVLNGTGFDSLNAIGVTTTITKAYHVPSIGELEVDTSFGYNSTTVMCVAMILGNLDSSSEMQAILDKENSSTALLTIQGKSSVNVQVQVKKLICVRLCDWSQERRGNMIVCMWKEIYLKVNFPFN